MKRMRGLMILTVVFAASIGIVAGCWAQSTSQEWSLDSQIRDASHLAFLAGVEDFAKSQFTTPGIGLETGAAAVAADILAQSLTPFLIPEGSSNPLADAYENMGKIATQQTVRNSIIAAFRGNLAKSTNPQASKIKVTDGDLNKFLQALTDQATRDSIMQKAAEYVKSTIDQDAAGKKLLQQRLTAVSNAIAVNFNKPVSAGVKAAVPEAKNANRYGDNFIALGYKVMSDILKDDKFKNLNKKFLQNTIDVIAQNDMLTRDGDLGAFRQGEDRAIEVMHAAQYVKSTIDQDAAGKKLLEQLVTAADTAITDEYNKSISADVKTAVPEAKDDNRYGDNFIALGYKVVDNILKDDRFKNLDKKLVKSLIDTAAQNNGIVDNGLAKFRQGEDRAINSTRAGTTKTANTNSQISGPQTTSQGVAISISRVLVIVLALARLYRGGVQRWLVVCGTGR